MVRTHYREKKPSPFSGAGFAIPLPSPSTPTLRARPRDVGGAGLGVCDSNTKDGLGVPCGTSHVLGPNCVSTYGSVCFFTISISDGFILSSLAAFLMGIFMQVP